MPTNPHVLPHPEFLASHKTGRLSEALTVERLTEILGEPERFDGLDEKVTARWVFTYKGQPCSVWDYRGARWSTFGPDAALAELFGDAYSVGPYPKN